MNIKEFDYQNNMNGSSEYVCSIYWTHYTMEMVEYFGGIYVYINDALWLFWLKERIQRVTRQQ